MKNINKYNFALHLGLSLLVVSALSIIIGESIYLGISANKSDSEVPEIIKYIDETKGGLNITDHTFEAEQCFLIGNSSLGKENLNHACPATSFFLNRDMHNGAAIRNINNKSLNLEEMNKLEFRFKSDKNAIVNLDISMSSIKNTNYLANNLTFTDLMTLNINGINYSYNNPLPSSLTGLEMCIVTPKIKINKGDNVLTLAPKLTTDNWLGIIDYINIKTSATITSEAYIWKDYDIEVSAFPTLDRFGSGILTCNQCKRKVKCDLPSISLGLKAGYYKSMVDSQDPGKINYCLSSNLSIVVSSNPLPKITKHKLRIVDPGDNAWFNIENESKPNTYYEAKETYVWLGHPLPDYDDSKMKHHIVGWIDANTKKYLGDEKTFAMPNHDLNVTPIYAPDKYVYSNSKITEGGIDFFKSYNSQDLGFTKPFHSNQDSIKGFELRYLYSNYSKGYVQTPTITVEGMELKYDEVNINDGFTLCADIFPTKNYNIELVYHLENKGDENISFVLNNTNLPDEAIQISPKEGLQKEVSLMKNEGKDVVISMKHIKGTDTFTGIRFLNNIKKLNLGIACYVRETYK